MLTVSRNTRIFYWSVAFKCPTILLRTFQIKKRKNDKFICSGRSIASLLFYEFPSVFRSFDVKRGNCYSSITVASPVTIEGHCLYLRCSPKHRSFYETLGLALLTGYDILDLQFQLVELLKYIILLCFTINLLLFSNFFSICI